MQSATPPVAEDLVPLGAELKQGYIVLDIVHSIHGRFRQIRLTPRSLKWCAGTICGVAILGTVLLGLCLYFGWKVHALEAMQGDYQHLQARYRELQTVSTERREAVRSLSSLASEVSAEYGITRPGQDLTANTKETVEQFNFLKAASYAGLYQRYAHQWQAHTQPSAWPVNGLLRSSFGSRSDPFSGEGEFHTGIDLAATSGTPVHVTADGVVVRAGWGGDYGKLVVVDHGNGFETYYAHLSQILVIPGEDVRLGQVVALSGGTGRATSPHLHYEVRVNGVPVNPYRFLTEKPELATAPAKWHNDLGF